MKVFKTALLFGLVGPLIGGWAIFAAPLFTEGMARLLGGLYLGVILYPLALYVGFIPAAVTGAIYAWLFSGLLFRHARSYLVNALVAGSIGALCSTICFFDASLFSASVGAAPGATIALGLTARRRRIAAKAQTSTE